MSVISLQFGQCGNQIGQSLFADLYSDIKSDTAGKLVSSKRANMDYIAQAVNKWFHVNKEGQWEARAILIDTEEKVTTAARDNPNYKFKSVASKSHGGSANNWAFGYSNKSRLLMKSITDNVRKEMEKCDSVSSIFSILSSSGGTGSGVGSKVLEILRDQFSNKLITNVTVLPYTCGEIVTQSYNSVLTLTHLYDTTDAIILYENDLIHKMCNKALSLTSVTFDDINSIIAQQLAAVLQPVPNVSNLRMIVDLATHPRYKLIQVRSAPHISKDHLKYEVSSTWAVLANRIRNSMKPNYPVYSQKSQTDATSRMKCVGNVLITRGHIPPTDDELKPLSEAMLYVPWLPTENRLVANHQPRNFKDLNKFATLVSNNNGVCPMLRVILEDASILFHSKAFVHHYKKFDIDEDFFADCFEKYETIIDDYNNI